MKSPFTRITISRCPWYIRTKRQSESNIFLTILICFLAQWPTDASIDFDRWAKQWHRSTKDLLALDKDMRYNCAKSDMDIWLLFFLVAKLERLDVPVFTAAFLGRIPTNRVVIFRCRGEVTLAAEYLVSLNCGSYFEVSHLQFFCKNRISVGCIRDQILSIIAHCSWA